MGTGYVLDWVVQAASIFNTMLLVWLGLTVLFSSERRNWGSWLCGGGLLLGASFFVSHSAILGQGLHSVSEDMSFWWVSGWAAITVLPLSWYMVMLWYAGYWENPGNSLYKRHRLWLGLVWVLLFSVAGIFIFANPMLSYSQVAQLNFSKTLTIGKLPVLVILYPLFLVLCLCLSLDILCRPAMDSRMMRELARRRARPWLIGTSCVLLLVSLLVDWVLAWIIMNAEQRTLYNIYENMEFTVARLDLIITGLISIAIVLLGQAVAAYEIFTGKSLPRRGLLQQWRSVVVLAGGFSLGVSLALTSRLPVIYSLLITTLLVTLFYAFFNWRTYVERERYIRHLRPFVASQRMYDFLVTDSLSTPAVVDISTPFQALCKEVLDTKTAYMAALGPLSPLVGPPLLFPMDRTTPAISLNEIVGRFITPAQMLVDLDNAGDMLWGVPLWSERGLIGVILLGEKRSGGLYTQEEIEIARSTGERLIDTQASAEIAQRLMGLQRQRMIESQILDQKTRRVLHDDILPLIHTAMLTLSTTPDKEINNDTIQSLATAHREISNLLREMPGVINSEVTRKGVLLALRRVLDEELKDTFHQICWKIEPGAEETVRQLPSLSAEVLFYAAREVIRNAARHSRGSSSTHPVTLKLEVCHKEDLNITIEDNGIGFSTERKAEKSSGGQGLVLHSTLMAVVGGTLVIESMPGQYTRVSLSLPLHLA